MDERSASQKRLVSAAPADVDAMAVLEALLFVASDPVEIRSLAETLDWQQSDVELHLDHLESTLTKHRRGVMLLRHDGTVQLVSAPRFGPFIERFLEVERRVRLSDAALETLAILAPPSACHPGRSRSGPWC